METGLPGGRSPYGIVLRGIAPAGEQPALSYSARMCVSIASTVSPQLEQSSHQYTRLTPKGLHMGKGSARTH